eukprot:6674927-Pyramimonas_sp.AAC.1
MGLENKESLINALDQWDKRKGNPSNKRWANGGIREKGIPRTAGPIAVPSAGARCVSRHHGLAICYAHPSRRTRNTQREKRTRSAELGGWSVGHPALLGSSSLWGLKDRHQQIQTRGGATRSEEAARRSFRGLRRLGGLRGGRTRSCKEASLRLQSRQSR